MNAPVSPPPSNAALDVNPVITVNGDAISITFKGATYVTKGRVAQILLSHRKRYDGDDAGAAGYWHGVLLCLTLAEVLATEKEQAHGKAEG